MPSLPAVLVLGVFFAFAGAVVVILSGGPPPPSSRSVQDEYAEAIAQLRFPLGKGPRADDPNAQAGGALNPGVGAVDAGNAWFCAWAIEWRDTRASEAARAVAALQELADAFPDGIFWRSLAHQDGIGLKGEVDAAIVGDGARLESEIAAFGCER
jgi:hypothetical protein